MPASGMFDASRKTTFGDLPKTPPSSVEGYHRSGTSPEMRVTSQGTPNSVTPHDRLCHSASPRGCQQANVALREATSPVLTASARPPLAHPHSEPPPTTIPYPRLPRISKADRNTGSSEDLSRSDIATSRISGSHEKTVISLISSDSDSNPDIPSPSSRQQLKRSGKNNQMLRPRLTNKIVDQRSTASKDSPRSISMPQQVSSLNYLNEESTGLDNSRNSARKRRRSCLQNEEMESPHSSHPAQLNSPSNTISVQSNPQPSIPPFEPAFGKPILLQAISKKLLSLIGKPATAKDGSRWEDGCIYVLQIPHCPEYVKIGRTKGDPDNRRKQLLKCGYELEVVDKGSFTAVPCHQRLEKIIHLDLRNRQHTFICSCKKSRKNGSNHDADGLTEHGEWFKIDSEDAIRTVDKWRGWMQRDPYDMDGNLKLEWQKRVSVFSCDRKYNSTTITAEDEAGNRWERFLSGPTFIDDAFLMRRQDSWGRVMASRWERMRRKKAELFAYSCFHPALSLVLIDGLSRVFPKSWYWVYLFIGIMSFLGGCYWL